MTGNARTVAALVVAASTAAACAGGAGDVSGAGGGRDTHRLVVIPGNETSQFYISLACGAQAAADQADVDLEVAAPHRWSAREQTAVVRDVRARSPDAVLISPVDEREMIAPMRELRRAGSTLVEVDTHVSDRSLGVSRIGSDNVKLGRMAAEEMAKRTTERATVMVLGVSPGTPTTQERADSFTRVLADDHPGVTVLDVRYTDDERERARRAVTEALAAHPELTGIFSTNLTTTLGAAEALRHAGAEDDITHVGTDAGPSEIDELENGAVDALLAQQPYLMGQEGVHEALHALAGKPVQERVETDLTLLDRGNLERRRNSTYRTHEC